MNVIIEKPGDLRVFQLLGNFDYSLLQGTKPVLPFSMLFATEAPILPPARMDICAVGIALSRRSALRSLFILLLLFYLIHLG